MIYYPCNSTRQGGFPLKCPYCAYPDSKVVDSRSTEEGETIRRRRECMSCARRFTTYEKIENVTLMVIKKDNRREPFDIGKIKKGLVLACQKRPVSMNDIDHIANCIEKKLYSTTDEEINTERIGEAVMEQLRDIDQVAYVRFASVYRQFTDVSSFMEELNRLLK